MKRVSCRPCSIGALAPAVCLLASLLILPACASAGTERETALPGDQNRLTAHEIQQRDHTNAFEVVQALRPQWLRQRGQTSLRVPQSSEVVIYVDGQLLGGPGTLRHVHASQVDTMQYLNASEATMRFGTGHSGGAIVILTRRS
jgi:hypothetical protein